MENTVEIEIKILKDGDEIIGIWDNRLLIKHKDGSADFFILEIDENGYPRLKNGTWKITKGDGEIHINNFEGKKRGESKSRRKTKVITF